MIKKKWKRCCFHYLMSDVADAIGIKPDTLTHYCSRNNIYLKSYSLLELSLFIVQERNNRGL